MQAWFRLGLVCRAWRDSLRGAQPPHLRRPALCRLCITTAHHSASLHRATAGVQETRRIVYAAAHDSMHIIFERATDSRTQHRQTMICRCSAAPPHREEAGAQAAPGSAVRRARRQRAAARQPRGAAGAAAGNSTSDGRGAGGVSLDPDRPARPPPLPAGQGAASRPVAAHAAARPDPAPVAATGWRLQAARLPASLEDLTLAMTRRADPVCQGHVGVLDMHTPLCTGLERLQRLRRITFVGYRSHELSSWDADEAAPDRKAPAILPPSFTVCTLALPSGHG